MSALTPHDWFNRHLACMLAVHGHETDADECREYPRTMQRLLEGDELAAVETMAKASMTQTACIALAVYEWYSALWANEQFGTPTLGHFGGAELPRNQNDRPNDI